MPYFKLLKSLFLPGCPLCSMREAAMEDWFDDLLYEHVNDRSLRKRFDAESGFCGRHARELGRSRDGLAVAILYRNGLSRAVAALAGDGELPVNRGCAACDHEGETESRYASLLADFLDDGELAAAYSPASALCVPHLARLRSLRTGFPAWFAVLHNEAYEGLLESLLRYIDTKGGIDPGEGGAGGPDPLVWKRLLELMTGRLREGGR
jgi:hypothetical protein